VPFPFTEIKNSRGKRSVPEKNLKPIEKYYGLMKDKLEYFVHFKVTRIRPLLRTAGHDHVVAAHYSSGNGHIIYLPYVDEE
jgi:hypothetical protein